MKKVISIVLEGLAVLAALIIFGVPFYFVFINSFKTSAEASEMNMFLPKTFHIIENYTAVINAQHHMVIRAFFNSTVITGFSIAVLIIVCSMAGFIMQRRQGNVTSFVNFIVLAGLMIPPSVVPTIWLLNKIGLYKTLPGIVFMEVALYFPFSAILYRGFMATIPKEIDEAAIVDGCGPLRLFFQIILPLLKPVTATIIVLSAVGIFNDFVNPLYFFPGAKNATVQLTLFNFMSMYLSSWNLLLADVILISIPPLVLFVFFNKRIVAGMTAGAIKG
jgi:raffinose/stachyose/melibiose transport system permease protein